MTDIFTQDGLKNILTRLKDSGVGIYRIKDLQCITSGILLRHDVDDEMETALSLASLEFGMGITSTFYFLLSCPTYNLLSQQGINIVKTISAMGHEVGLHFDPSIYEDIDTNFYREIGILEDLLGNKVDSFATHAPSLHGIYPQFNGVIDAYDKRLFSSNNYFSDSRLMFSGNIDDIIKKAGTGVVQLLFHPISYYLRDENKNPNIISLYKNIIERFGSKLIQQISKMPAFVHEIDEHTTSNITINIQIKED